MSVQMVLQTDYRFVNSTYVRLGKFSPGTYVWLKPAIAGIWYSQTSVKERLKVMLKKCKTLFQVTNCSKIKFFQVWKCWAEKWLPWLKNYEKATVQEG